MRARFEGSLLAPTSDATLAAISRHKSTLERHYVVGCTDWEITKLYLEKKYTYELAEKVGVPAPKTTVPHSIEDVERYAETVQYPCLVKPCQGHQYFEVFRTKMVKVENLDQMLDGVSGGNRRGLRGDAAGVHPRLGRDELQLVLLGRRAPWSSSPRRRSEALRVRPGLPAWF